MLNEEAGANEWVLVDVGVKGVPVVGEGGEDWFRAKRANWDHNYGNSCAVGVINVQNNSRICRSFEAT